MFDATINVVNTDVLYDADQPMAQLIFVAGMLLPLQMQAGAPPLIAPAGALRIPLDKQAMLELAEKMIDTAETMPDARADSGLIIPGDPGEADRLAAEMGRMRGNGS